MAPARHSGIYSPLFRVERRTSARYSSPPFKAQAPDFTSTKGALTYEVLCYFLTLYVVLYMEF